ncbi:hypothetical protein ACSBR1_023885 [Camellia fascicularis]
MRRNMCCLSVIGLITFTGRKKMSSISRWSTSIICCTEMIELPMNLSSWRPKQSKFGMLQTRYNQTGKWW